MEPRNKEKRDGEMKIIEWDRKETSDGKKGKEQQEGREIFATR